MLLHPQVYGRMQGFFVSMRSVTEIVPTSYDHCVVN